MMVHDDDEDVGASSIILRACGMDSILDFHFGFWILDLCFPNSIGFDYPLQTSSSISKAYTTLPHCNWLFPFVSFSCALTRTLDL